MIDHYSPQVLIKRHEDEERWIAPCAFLGRTDARTIEEAQSALSKIVSENQKSDCNPQDRIIATRIVFWQETEKKIINEQEIDKK